MKRVNLASRQQQHQYRSSTRNNNNGNRLVSVSSKSTKDIPSDDSDLDDILNSAGTGDHRHHPQQQTESLDSFLSEIATSSTITNSNNNDSNNNDDAGTIISKAITLGTIHEDKSGIISTSNNSTANTNNNDYNDNDDNDKVTRTTKTYDDASSVNSGGGSVFTEKKQDDIDRLFEDLLGPSSSRRNKRNNNNNIDYEDVSVASSAMSSVMPVITTTATNTSRYRSSNNNKRKENGLFSRKNNNNDDQSINTTTTNNNSVINDDDDDDDATYYTLFSSSARKSKQHNNNNYSNASIASSASDAYSTNEYIKRDNNSISNSSIASKQSNYTNFTSGNSTIDDSTIGGSTINTTMTKQTVSSVLPIEERFYKIYAERRKRMLHLRAAFTLFILVAIMFAIVQFTSVNTYNSNELKTLRQDYQYHTITNKNNFKNGNNANNNVGNEEGLDRPLRANQMIGLNQRASSSGFGHMSNNDASTNQGGKTLAADSKSKNTQNTNNNNNGPVDLLFDTPQDQQQQPIQDQQQEDKSKPDAIQMPASFANYADNNKPDSSHIDMPILWQVPMSGSKTIRDILSYCLEFTLACEMGSKGAYSVDKQLEVFTMNDAKFINVDTTYIKGIERAKQLKLVQSQLVNVIVTPYIHEVSTILSPSHQGRVFAMLRHPVFRATSTYQFLKKTDAVVAKWSLVQYASSDRIENNWMTRFLSNHHSGEVTMEHLILAKEILRTKVLIGLEDNNWVSLKRFESYFDWKYIKDPTKQFECRKQFLVKREEAFDYKVDNQNSIVKEGSQIWTLILWQNKFDMKLYQYAEKLFEEQGKLFPGIPLK